MQGKHKIMMQKEIKHNYAFGHFIICFLLFTLIYSPVFALEFDTSLDDEIRKNYDPTKIEKDMELPALPKIINEKSVQTINNNTKTNKTSTANLKPISQIKPQTKPLMQSISLSQGSYATLKHGTVFRVKSLNNISDSSPRGYQVAFISKYPVSTTYYTIPVGSILKGEIIKSHRPQLSGNGGLIVVRINSLIINNEIHPIEAFVSEANNKNIFFNNIKGKRKYISSVFKSTKPGCHFFKKMISVTESLAKDGSSIILTPFSIGAGAIALSGNIFVSPVLGLFYKGDSIHIKEGSEFKIKLAQDVFIYN